MRWFLVTAIAIVIAGLLTATVAYAGGGPQVQISQSGNLWVIDITITDGSQVLVRLNGNAIQQPAPAPVSALVVPGGQIAWGSCIVYGRQRDLVWDPTKRRLYMDPWLSEARQAIQSMSIDCNFTAYAPVIIEVAPSNINWPGGFWSKTFPQGDGSFGFAAQAR